MKFANYLAAAAALAIAPAAVQAQDVGATVMGNDDNPVGTVVSNDGTTVTVDTGTYQAPLPANAFGTSEAGPTLNLTQAQLNDLMAQQVAAQEAAAAEAAAAQAAAEAEAAAALAAALVVGAPVITSDAQPLGVVDEFVGENVVVKAEDETLITLPRNFFAVDANGSLMALAELDAIMAAVNGG
jgi:hypothetical protein